MLAGTQLSLCSSVNQRQPMVSDWAEHFGFSYLIMRVLNAVCCGLGQNQLTRGCKGGFLWCKRIRIACHSVGSCRAEALLKKSFRELRCPQLGLQSGKNNMLYKTTNKYLSTALRRQLLTNISFWIPESARLWRNEYQSLMEVSLINEWLSCLQTD